MMQLGNPIPGAKSVAFLAVGSGAAQQVVAATAGKRIRVHGYTHTGNGAASVIQWSDGSPLAYGPGGLVTTAQVTPAFWFQTAAGAALSAIVDNGTVYLGNLVYSLVD